MQGFFDAAADTVLDHQIRELITINEHDPLT
jgi:hypothetical protein